MSIIEIVFLLSHGLNALAGLFVLLVTFQRYLLTKIKIILYFSFLFSTWTIVNTLLILPILLPSIQTTVISANITVIDLISSLNVIGSAITVSLLILFFDAFEGDISPIKTAVAVGAVLVSIFLAIAGLSSLFIPSLDSETVKIVSRIIPLNDTALCVAGTNDCLITMRWSTISSLIIFPVTILALIWGYQLLSEAKKYAIASTQLNQLKLMRLALWIISIGVFFGVLGVILVDSNFLVAGTYSSEILGYTIVSIGVLIIGITYISNTQIAFLQPQRIDAVLVINQAGLPLLKYEFRPKAMEGEAALFSGAITAISALLKEAVGVTSDIEKIQFQDRELLLKFKKGIGFILITQRASSYLANSLNQFGDRFIEQFEKEIEFPAVDTETFKVAIPELRLSFGLNPNIE